MASCLNITEEGKTEYVISGGADNTVKVYINLGTKLQIHAQHKVDATPRSVDLYNDHLLVGTSGGTIYEFKNVIT